MDGIDDNKRNLCYFEAATMADLFTAMDAWQVENRKRLLSMSVQPDAGRFCCIALTNPTEVHIVYGGTTARVSGSGRLLVADGPG